IILRGRQRHLFAEFVSKHDTLDDPSVISIGRSAWHAYLQKNLPLLPEDLKPQNYTSEADRVYGRFVPSSATSNDAEAKLRMHRKTAAVASKALVEAESQSIDIQSFYGQTQDVLLPYLDKLYGSSIDASDYSIFTRLTQEYEKRFMEDVRALNVLDPTIVTRVTEYSEEIVEYVKQIISNGFAYATSDGSVYFDIVNFEKSGFPYARLEPWNRNDSGLQADGEGALTAKTTEKRSEADFALWKSSKPGEPSWPSPWGPGRPGWHIVMASDILKDQIDIHSGGIDLCFPHHDNELAQSEAYWSSKHSHEQGGQHQWVNYFMHMGHLSIQGSKMSKSLKNFTTIREALSRGDWTPRGLRIVFLLGGWKDGIEITDDLVKAGNAWESKVDNFFLKANDLQRNPPKVVNGNEEGSKLAEALTTAEAEVFEALCDSFDTPSVMRIISQLISTYNSADKTTVSDEDVLTVARWITKMVNTFGLDSHPSQEDRIGWSGIDIPEIAKPFVYPISRLRDEVRQRAIAGEIVKEELVVLASKDKVANLQDMEAVPYAETLSQFQDDVRELAEKGANKKDILDLCDRVRDFSLWNLGVYLEDRDGQPALVRPVDRELVSARKAKDDAKAAKDKKAAEKVKQSTKGNFQQEAAAKEAAKAEKAKIPPSELFRTGEYEGLYSEWDDQGIPTKDKEGKEVAKSQGKKLKKIWDAQKKAYDAYISAA
ncbi:hypothetical protein LTR04_005763, partial [Oleoguttula sp. CCFEE 6159]